MTSPTEYATAAQQLAAAVAASSQNPADSVRLLAQFAVVSQPAVVATTDAITTAANTVQAGTAALFRRAAVVALARASARYQPASADDAAQVRTAVCDALDAEILMAANSGEDATFSALRALHAAVTKDLSTRGAALPLVVDIASKQAQPAPVLAQRLYRTPSRAEELITQAEPAHPAFMPTTFKGLGA